MNKSKQLILFTGLIYLLITGCDTLGITEPENSVPVANPGTSQTVYTDIVVSLDGSQSNDKDKDSLKYSWIITKKPTDSISEISNSTSSNPTFTPDLPGEYVIQLIVNDGKEDSEPTTVTITAQIKNIAPVASPGSNQTVGINNLVLLNGKSSSDENRDAITYKWIIKTAPSNSKSSLSDATIANPTFTPEIAGDYIIELVVNDGKIDSAPASITITAKGFVGKFSRTWIQPLNGGHYLVNDKEKHNEIFEMFIGDGSTTDHDNNPATPDITFETGFYYSYSTVNNIETTPVTQRWKMIIKAENPAELTNAELLSIWLPTSNTVGLTEGWYTSGSWYDGYLAGMRGTTNKISADGMTLIQTSNGGKTVNNFSRE